LIIFHDQIGATGEIHEKPWCDYTIFERKLPKNEKKADISGI
jgi:hypothetical protein